MAQENVYSIRASVLCDRPVHTCAPGDVAAEAARRMTEAGVSSLVVCRGYEPIGIVTDRDFRMKVVARGLDARNIPVESIMSAPLVSIGREDYLFEAFYKMSRHNVHRVAILDEFGNLSGLVTDSDLLKIQTGSPQFLIRDIEAAHSRSELKALYARAGRLVSDHLSSGMKTMDLVRLLSHIHDAILDRLINLLKAEEFPGLTPRYALLALGSEGRMEQTLKTDQDNALLYDDSLGPAEREELAAFSRRLIDEVVEIGVPPCPGGIMASNEAWRKSLSEWKERVRAWTSALTPDNVMNFSMFSDLRLLSGEQGLADELAQHLRRCVAENELFAIYMARNVQRFPPPIGWFGHFKCEKEGPHRGRMDVKKGGIFPITEGVKLLALTTGAAGVGTWDRIGTLADAKVLSADEALELRTSFSFLVYLRVRSQVQALEQGKAPSDYVDPRILNVVERHRLRVALETVESFQSFIKARFQLDLIR